MLPLTSFKDEVTTDALSSNMVKMINLDSNPDSAKSAKTVLTIMVFLAVCFVLWTVFRVANLSTPYNKKVSEEQIVSNLLYAYILFCSMSSIFSLANFSFSIHDSSQIGNFESLDTSSRRKNTLMMTKLATIHRGLPWPKSHLSMISTIEASSPCVFTNSVLGTFSQWVSCSAPPFTAFRILLPRDKILFLNRKTNATMLNTRS